MSSLEDSRQEFNVFMRKLVSDPRCLVYYDDAKRLMRLMLEAAPTISVRALNKKELEPIVTKAEYMMAKMSMDRRADVRSLIPPCFRAVAYRLGGKEALHLLLVQMVSVSKEIMQVTPSVRPQSVGVAHPVRHDSEPAPG